MIELLDPAKIDPIAYNQHLLEEIREFSLLPDKRIGWNYCMDYTWLAMRCEGFLRPGMRIIDIGAGPGAIHGYLEDRCGVSIIGVDIQRWEKDYVDLQGDFTNEKFRKENGFLEHTLDGIISTSSFEHNNPSKHQKLVQACLKTLKPGGRLITTFATSSRKTHYFKPSYQWNISAFEIEAIYGEPIVNFAEYEAIWERYHIHREIPNAHRARYGTWTDKDPGFLSIGADILNTSEFSSLSPYSLWNRLKDSTPFLNKLYV